MHARTRAWVINIVCAAAAHALFFSLVLSLTHTHMCTSSPLQVFTNCGLDGAKMATLNARTVTAPITAIDATK